MKQLVIALLVLHVLALQSWADCAWVLIEKKKYPEQLVTDPPVETKVMSYSESQSECSSEKERTLSFSRHVVGESVVNHEIARKDERGREAYYAFDCIPATVLSIYLQNKR